MKPSSSLLSRRLLSRRAFWRLALLAAPGATAIDALGVEPEWIKVRTVRVSAARPALRVAHFTDVHYKGNRALLERAVRIMNGLAPDFACFTGDLIENMSQLPEALEILRTVSCPLYGVPGNHDYWADADWDSIRACFAATGGAWLMDEQTRTKDGRAAIIGLSCVAEPRFTLEPGRRNIALLHYPQWSERLGEAKPDLMLAGHSHGGQVRLPFYGALLTPSGVGEFEMGLYETPRGPLYVNPGLGYFYCNVRLFCRPEITLIEI